MYNSDPEKFGSSICFHSQQAVEKYFKAYLAYKGFDFKKTNDLDYLLNECQKFNEESFKGIDLKSLTDFGVSIRYPDDFYIPEEDEVEYYREIPKKIKTIIESLIIFD